MKSLSKLALLITSFIIFSVATANAKEFYVGVKFGYEEIMSYGVYGGVNFNKNFGVETDFSIARHTPIKKTLTNYGVYGTYRIGINKSNSLYFKSKLGVAQSNFRLVNTSDRLYSHTTDGAGVGVALGFGYQKDKVGTEILFNHLNNDASAISIGTHVHF